MQEPEEGEMGRDRRQRPGCGWSEKGARPEPSKRAASESLEEEPERTIHREEREPGQGGGLQNVVRQAKSDGGEAQAVLGLGQRSSQAPDFSVYTSSSPRAIK